MDVRAVIKLASDLYKADVQCCTSKELILRVGRIWEDPAPTVLLKRLYELRFTNQHTELLQVQVESLLLNFETLSGKDRAVVNSRLKRIILLLPSQIASFYGHQFINDKRKSRRDIGVSIIKKTGLLAEHVHYYIEKFKELGDQELLEYVARSPKIIASLDWIWLLENLEQRYWRMRVIEALLESANGIGHELIEQYAYEYVYACGRKRRRINPNLFSKLIAKRNEDIEFLGICIWTCGRTRARQTLKLLHAIYVAQFEPHITKPIQQE